MDDRVMDCPFCGRGLRIEDATEGGRYGCGSCAETSEEARRGWLPVPHRAPRSEAAQAGAVDPMFAVDQRGRMIQRRTRCECGREFTQKQLSARFLEAVELHSARAIALIEKDIPGMFVPVHCPPCERKDLRLPHSQSEARLAFRGVDRQEAMKL